MAKELGNVEPFFDATSAIPANSADAAVTAMNLHDAINRSEEAGLAFVKDIYNVLKPGGVAAVAATGDVIAVSGPASPARR